MISLMSTGRLFHALGAAMENDRSDETSLERGTTRSCLPAERREARPGMLATGVSNSVRYDGARPLQEVLGGGEWPLSVSFAERGCD